MRKPKPKRGRPPSGRWAYCIRMFPRSYAVLLKTAKGKGLSLGAWMEQVAMIRTHFTSLMTEEEAEDFVLLARRFDVAVAEATEVTQELLEMLDQDPVVARGNAKPGLKKLVEVHGYLVDFLRSEGIRFKFRD